MDTLYIKMVDCEEIQRQWKPTNGDWVYWRLNGDCYPICEDRYYTIEELAEGHIWLPTQDQLQEMIKDKYETFVDLLQAFYLHWMGYKDPEQELIQRDWIEDADIVRIMKDFTSMEQLWLAFVMKEKYNKIWNGKDWISATQI